MKQEFIVKGEKSPYSRAERHLAERLKTLRRDYKGDKQTFVDHLTKKVDDIQFTKAEADRIWDRMHKLQYFSDGETIVMLDKKHKLHFPQYFYSGNNNSFDNYAVELLSKDVFVHHGGVPGVCTEAKARAMAKARAARWGKCAPEEPKEEPVAEVIETSILSEYAQPLIRPDQLTDAELDEHIAEIQATLNAFMFEKNKRAEIVARKRELYKTMSELVESEGFTLEEIMDTI